MTVDACSILEETLANQAILDYQLSCANKSYINIIGHYMNTIKCCECYDKPAKCNKSSISACDSEGNGNAVISVNCCDLCIFPNEEFPGLDVCAVAIVPNNTIINVKMISPNNMNQCQE